MKDGSARTPQSDAELYPFGAPNQSAPDEVVDITFVLREAFTVAARMTLNVEDAVERAEAVGDDWEKEIQTDPTLRRSRSRTVGFILTCHNRRRLDEAKAQKVRRRARRKLKIDAEIRVPEWADPAAVAELNERRDAVRAAVEQLPEPRCRIVTLFWFEEWRRAEIAADYDSSVGLIAKELGIAYEELRVLLAGHAPLALRQEQA